jgi:RimJ/RimL family protein N-acetyltransferase
MKAVVKLHNYLWRALTDSDADTDFAVALRNDERFGKWFYNRVTRESHKRFLAAAAGRAEINWIIERDGKPVGASSIYHIDFENRKAEVGRIASFDPRMFYYNWVVSAHVADVCIGLNKLYIEMYDTNIISRAVEKLGMVREALMRHHVIINGQPMNVLMYGSVRPEWEAMRASIFERFGTPEIISYEGERLEPLHTTLESSKTEPKEVAI